MLDFLKKQGKQRIQINAFSDILFSIFFKNFLRSFDN